MMKFFLSAILLHILSISCAQSNRFEFGGRQGSLAGASVGNDDAYSLFNNIGGLSFVEKTTIIGGYKSQYGIPALQVVVGGAVLKTNFLTSGIGIFKYGDDLFSVQRFNFALSHKIQTMSLGIGFDLIQYNVSTVGTRQIFSVQFGGLFQLLPELFLGFNIFNINQAIIDEKTNEKIPTIIKVGISYRPIDELMLNVEVEKDLTFREVLKAGIEYQMIKNIFLRTGVKSRPLIASFGLGFILKSLHLDYAYSNHVVLGANHNVSLAFEI